MMAALKCHVSCLLLCFISWLVLQELGADETVNYREQDFAEVYKDKPFDFIFDSVGGMVVPTKWATAVP